MVYFSDSIGLQDSRILENIKTLSK